MSASSIPKLRDQESEEDTRENAGFGKILKYLPDTSSILNGTFRRLLYRQVKEEFENIEVFFSRAMLFELESLANRGYSSGIAGLSELSRIRDWLDRQQIPVDLVGSEYSFEFQRLLDNGLIRETQRRHAEEAEAILVTCDKVQSTMAKAEGIEVILLQPESEGGDIPVIEDFFDADTMSIHLKAGVVPKAKRGSPGQWKLVNIGTKPLDPQVLSMICDSIIERARRDENSFVESEEKGTVIVQMGSYRIVITSPPFSSSLELTAVRPITKMTLEDYEVDPRLLERLRSRAEGILIGGAPGAGKSTLATALAEFYSENGNIVKTLESPRDLQVGQEITQLDAGDDPGTVADVLLLTRPDYVIFDEVRKTRDFEVFTDLRLAGIGLVGIVHATKPIDAIQRFIGRVDLGLIPSIIDTVIFVEKGELSSVMTLEMTVKTPSGMTHSDLARPVIEVRDFYTNTLLYELFTFGDQITVVPIQPETTLKFARQEPLPKRGKSKKSITSRIAALLPRSIDFDIQPQGNNKFAIIVPPWDYKKARRKVKTIEKKLNVKVTIVKDPERSKYTESHYVHGEVSDELIILYFDDELAGQLVQLMVDTRPLTSLRVGKNAMVKIEKESTLGEELIDIISSGRMLSAYVI